MVSLGYVGRKPVIPNLPFPGDCDIFQNHVPTTAMHRKDDHLGTVWLPLDRETREWLMERARKEGSNPLDLGAELLKAMCLAERAVSTTTH